MKFVRFILGATICLFAVYGGYELYVQKFTKNEDSGDIFQELRDAGYNVGSGDVKNDLSAMMQSDLGTPTASFGMEASHPPTIPESLSSGTTSGGLPPSLRRSAAPTTAVFPEQPLQMESVQSSLHSPETFQPSFDASLFLNPGGATILTPPPTLDASGEATSTGQAITETPSPNWEWDFSNTTQPIPTPPAPSVPEQMPEQTPKQTPEPPSSQWPSTYTFGVAMPPTVDIATTEGVLQGQAHVFLPLTTPAEQRPVNTIAQETAAQETAAYRPMIATPHPQVRPLPPIENDLVTAQVNQQVDRQVVIPHMQVISLPPVEDEVPTTETRWAMTPALPHPPQIALPDPPQLETQPAGQPPQYVQNDPGSFQPSVTIPTQVSPYDQQFVRQDNPPQTPQLPPAPFAPATVPTLPPSAATSEVQQAILPQNPVQKQIEQVNSVTPLPQSQDSGISPEVAVKVAKIGELLKQGQVSDAYEELSRMYFYDEMTPEEQQYVAKHLDLLAGGVLFSRRHHILEPPYMVKEGDTIESIATQYKITPELLRKLNRIPGGANAVAGTELKVLRGPLDARIYPNYHELVVMIRDKYACRFPISVGSSYAGQEGSFTVQEKALNRAYQLAPGMEIIPPGDPNNPLGAQWIELSKEQGTIGIHGTNRPEQIGTTRRSAGFFGLCDQDIAEVYDMLTIGSNVTIVR